MPIVPHPSELAVSLLWAGLVVLLIVVLSAFLLRRRRHKRAVNPDLTSPRDEQGEKVSRGR